MANSHSKGETMNITGLFPAKCFEKAIKLFLLRGMMKIKPKSQISYLHKDDLDSRIFYQYKSNDHM